jgi:aspartyl/glutamyl-tRNA(Asn/Gln) amidotransferase C subunit
VCKILKKCHCGSFGFAQAKYPQGDMFCEAISHFAVKIVESGIYWRQFGDWLSGGSAEMTSVEPERGEITPDLFEHLVGLAALELSPDEAEYLRRELNNQLKAIHELEAIPLDADMPMTSHGVPYTPQISPTLREDEWLPDPHPENIVRQAPETEDGYIIVPDIPHTELE